jgi:hypothetical protein
MFPHELLQFCMRALIAIVREENGRDMYMGTNVRGKEREREVRAAAIAQNRDDRQMQSNMSKLLCMLGGNPSPRHTRTYPLQ